MRSFHAFGVLFDPLVLGVILLEPHAKPTIDNVRSPLQRVDDWLASISELLVQKGHHPDDISRISFCSSS